MSRSAFRIVVAFVMIYMAVGVQPVQAAPEPAALAAEALPKWRCYDDGSLDPCHDALNAVSFLNASEGWAVGSAGKILRFQGGIWSVYPSPVTSYIYGLQVLTAINAWAVGENSILHWDGNAWTDFPISIAGMKEIHLSSLYMLNANEGWAAGTGYTTDDSYSGSVLLHWNGAQWQQVDLSIYSFVNPPYFTDSKIWASAANNIWITGDYGNAFLLHWNGSVWSDASLSGYSINRISGVSANNIWGIGYSTSGDNYNVSIFHWNGSSWSVHSNLGSFLGLGSITMVSSTQGWIMGDRYLDGWEDSVPVVFTWNGAAWTETSLPGDEKMKSIAAPDAAHAWAVGTHGAILQWIEGVWSEAVEGYTPDNINALGLVSSTDGWAVGSGGVIKQFNGTDWADWSSPTTAELRSLEVISANDIWAFGGDNIHWDGASWSIGTLPATLHFGWRIATGGMEHWNGTAWDFYALPVSPYSMYMASATDGWVVGSCHEEGCGYNDPAFVFHWNGTAWAEDESYNDHGLDSAQLRGFSSNDVWIIGERTAHWDGTTWHTYLTEEAGRGFHDLKKVGADDYFAVGLSGFRHWNMDGIVESSSLPSDCTMDTIDMLSTTEGWAWGYGCPLAHYSADFATPTPVLSGLSLYGIVGEGKPRNIGLQGENFTMNSVVRLNDTLDLETEYNSENSLSAVIPGEYMVAPNELSLRVINPPDLESDELTLEVYGVVPLPGSTALTGRPGFDWANVSKANAYEIEIYTPKKLWLKKVTETSFFRPEKDLPRNTLITWRYHARVGSSWKAWSESFTFTSCNPPTIPVLRKPANKSLVYGDPVLMWKKITGYGGGDFASYHLQVATDSDFKNLSVEQNITDPDTTQYVIESGLVQNTKYYWRMRAYNDLGQYSNWTAVKSFRTALMTPQLIGPEEGAELTSLRPKFSWFSLSGAASYTVQVSTSPTFKKMLINKRYKNSFYAPKKLPANRTLYWRVRANGSNGPSLWSTTTSFIIKP